MPSDETVLRIELQGSSGIAPPTTGAGSFGQSGIGSSAVAFEKQPVAYSRTFDPFADTQKTIEREVKRATSAVATESLSRVGSGRGRGKSSEPQEEKPFDPFAEAQKRIESRAMRARVEAAEGMLQPFDAKAEAQKKVDAEKRNEEIDRAYKELKPGAPFDAKAEAQKRVEAEKRRDEIEKEYRTLKPETMTVQDRWTKGLATSIGVLQGFNQALSAASNFVRSNTQISALTLEGGDPVEIRSLEKKKQASLGGSIVKGVADVGAAILAATGVGLPLAGAFAVGGNLLGSGIEKVGELKTEANEDRFVAQGKALRGRARRLSQFGGPIAGALARSDAGQIRRDIAESRAIGPALAALTDAESEYNRVNQQIQAVKRQKEAGELQKKTIEETQKMRKELAGLIKQNGEWARKVAEAVGTGGMSPLKQLIKGIEVPNDHTPDVERQQRKEREERIKVPVFAGL